MNIGVNSDDYQKGLDLAEAGNHEQAIQYIQRYLIDNPSNFEALNDAGAILHCLGRGYEAIASFRKAKSIQPDNPQVLWNLAEVYVATAEITEFMLILADLEHAKVLNADILNRAANAALGNNQKNEAIELLLVSIQKWPSQAILEPMLDIIRSKMPKVAYFTEMAQSNSLYSSTYTFLNERYFTKLYSVSNGSVSSDIDGTIDIAWLDNCPVFAKNLSYLPKTFKIILDLSKTDLPQDIKSQINWDNIDVILAHDNLLLPAQAVRKVVNIDFGVELKRYHLADKPRGKKIVCLDHLDAMSNPMQLIQCIQKLNYFDSEFRLYFAGSIVSNSIERYLRNAVSKLGLEEVVFFGDVHEDLNIFLADKHFIASARIDSACVENVFAGMACGLKPLVHNFPNAADVFDAGFIFDISEQFCEIALSESYEPLRYRNFVKAKIAGNNKFDVLRKAMAGLDELVEAGSPVVPQFGRAAFENHNFVG